MRGLSKTSGAHTRRPKNCPLYENAELDATIDTGPQILDPTCRKNIAKKIPKELPALEKILRVFDEE